MSRVKRITREQYLELTAMGIPCIHLGWRQRPEMLNPMRILSSPDSLEWAQIVAGIEGRYSTYLTVVDDEESND